MVYNRLLYAIALLCGMGFYGLYYAWYSWFLLLVLLAVPLLSVLLTLPTLLRLRVALTCPAGIPRGQAAAAKLTVGGSFLHPACRARIMTTNRCTNLHQKQEVRLLDGNQYVFPLPTEHCASFQLQVQKLWIYDYLGLFRLPVRRPPAAELLVLPIPQRPKPAPDLKPLTSPPLRPQAPGTFAEVHEFRSYRPGDNLRDVHWKLTAKLDELVVKEPLGPQPPKALVTVDLSGTPEERDRTLDGLCWLGQWLLEHELPFTLAWAGEHGEDSVPIAQTGDLEAAVNRLLRLVPAEGAWLRNQSGGAGWHCHLDGKEADT